MFIIIIFFISNVNASFRRSLLAALMPSMPKAIMRLVITHLEAAVDGDGDLSASDVLQALQWSAHAKMKPK
jgi:hypothetical protein